LYQENTEGLENNFPMESSVKLGYITLCSNHNQKHKIDITSLICCKLAKKRPWDTS